MAKTNSPRVVFKMQRIAADDWQIEAHYPGTDVRHIKGFKSKAEVDEWLERYRALWQQRLAALHTEVARGKRERRSDR